MLLKIRKITFPFQCILYFPHKFADLCNFDMKVRNDFLLPVTFIYSDCIKYNMYICEMDFFFFFTNKVECECICIILKQLKVFLYIHRFQLELGGVSFNSHYTSWPKRTGGINMIKSLRFKAATILQFNPVVSPKHGFALNRWNLSVQNKLTTPLRL